MLLQGQQGAGTVSTYAIIPRHTARLSSDRATVASTSHATVSQQRCEYTVQLISVSDSLPHHIHCATNSLSIYHIFNCLIITYYFFSHFVTADCIWHSATVISSSSRIL